MRKTMILSLFLTATLAACAQPSPWSDWESAPKTGGAAVAGSEPGYKDYTPRSSIESAPLGGAPAAQAPGTSPYDTSSASVAAPGTPTPLHSGPFAVATQQPVAYTGTPVAQRTLPLALSGTGISR